MKTNFLSGGGSMRNAIVLSVLLLSACATEPHVGGTADAQPAHRESVATPQPAPQPVAPPKSAPVEVQQPAPSGQGDIPPKKPKHNVEED